MAFNGGYDLHELSQIIAPLRVAGNENVAHIKSMAKQSDYDDLTVLSKKTNLVYRELTSTPYANDGRTNSSPVQLKQNVKHDLEAFLTQGVADPCTFYFSMHCGNHFIPMVCRVTNGEMEIMVS